MSKVSIPEPCHEDWNEMTPTQRGAFCQKCAIDVIDFSHKSPIEVRETLKTNMGKHICGRFKKSQLEDLNQAYHMWENQSLRTFRSKFLWACLMAFGMTLFTACDTTQAQELSLFKNTTTFVVDDTTMIKTDTNGVVTTVELTDSLIIKPDFTNFELGDIEYSEETEDISETLMIKGEVAIIECSPTDSIKVDTVSPTSVIESHPEMLLGRFIPPPHFDEFLIDTIQKATIPERIQTKTMDALVYPNPTYGEARLIVDPKEKRVYQIDLYTFEGKHLHSIYGDILEEKKHTFKLDLTPYPTGVYFIRITTNGETKALKIDKVNS